MYVCRDVRGPKGFEADGKNGDIMGKLGGKVFEMVLNAE